MYLLPFLAGLVLFASGCSGNTMCRIRLLRLSLENPVRDAERALMDGKREVIGVYGYAVELPGVPDDWKPRGGYTVRMIEGTSDVIIAGPCERFKAAARNYARDYNAVVVKASMGGWTARPSNHP